MLLDLLDPVVTWSKTYSLVVSKDISRLDLALFFLKHFRVHDEESQYIHIPFVLMIVLDQFRKVS